MNTHPPGGPDGMEAAGIIAEGTVCPECGGVILQSQNDPSDPFWYCTEDDCVWQGDAAPQQNAR